METDNAQTLRHQLVKHLKGGEAFLPIDTVIHKIPFDKTGIVPEGLPYSLWQQFFHLQYAQYDILEFSRNPQYKKVKWPDDYWPEGPAPKDEQEWENTVNRFIKERQQFCDMIMTQDLFEPFEHGKGQTLLREAMLAIEHTAYHTGQIFAIMRLLGLHDEGEQN